MLSSLINTKCRLAVDSSLHNCLQLGTDRITSCSNITTAQLLTHAQITPPAAFSQALSLIITTGRTSGSIAPHSQPLSGIITEKLS